MKSPFNRYEEDGYDITEYTKDGTTISARIKLFIPPENETGYVEQQPTLEEMQAQTLLNTEMLLIYKELETGV